MLNSYLLNEQINRESSRKQYYKKGTTKQSKVKIRIINNINYKEMENDLNAQELKLMVNAKLC